MAASWLLNALKSTSHSKIARTIRPGKIYPTRRPEPEPDPNFRVWVCQIRVRVKNGSTRMTRIRIRVGYGSIKFGSGRNSGRIRVKFGSTRVFTMYFSCKLKFGSGSGLTNSGRTKFGSGSGRPEFDSGRVRVWQIRVGSNSG